MKTNRHHETNQQLRPAVEVMAREGEILPATGQAIEDLMRPNQEKARPPAGTCQGRESRYLLPLPWSTNRYFASFGVRFWRVQKQMFCTVKPYRARPYR